MATKQEMCCAGRKIRTAFKNYVAALSAAEEAGIDVFAKSVQVGPDGEVIPAPTDPNAVYITSLHTLRNFQFWFAHTQRVDQSDLDDDADEMTPTA